MSQRVDALLDAFRRDEPGDIAIERSPGATEVKVGSDLDQWISVGEAAEGRFDCQDGGRGWGEGCRPGRCGGLTCPVSGSVDFSGSPSW